MDTGEQPPSPVDSDLEVRPLPSEMGIEAAEAEAYKLTLTDLCPVTMAMNPRTGKMETKVTTRWPEATTHMVRN